jgi:hypothetical protein
LKFGIFLGLAVGLFYLGEATPVALILSEIIAVSIY